MSLARGLTTTSTRGRKTNITKSQQEELERGWRDRNVRLKEMHLPKETFEQYLEWVYGKGTKTKTEKKYKTEYSSTTTVASPKTKSAETGVTIHSMGDKSSCNKDDISISKTRHWVTGACATKPSPTYTGTKVIGISQMAKSNAVPVFSQDEIIDIASMRR